MQIADDGENDELPPEKRLDTPNTRLIDSGIATIPDMETLQECVAYDHQNRTQILRRLECHQYGRTTDHQFPTKSGPATQSGIAKST